MKKIREPPKMKLLPTIYHKNYHDQGTCSRSKTLCHTRFFFMNLTICNMPRKATVIVATKNFNCIQLLKNMSFLEVFNLSKVHMLSIITVVYFVC